MEENPKEAVNILHPLATLEWTETLSSSVPGSVVASCVYLNNRLYIATGENYQGCSRGFSVEQNLLSAFDIHSNKLKRLQALPVERFALTHYHSQLVLVGGKEPGSEMPTNKLWQSADGTKWEASLPPMSVKRSDASAVNISPQEYLVVVGGADDKRWLTTVEVLVEEEWFTVQSLPGYPHYPRAHIYNGNLIVTETYRTFYSSWRGGSCRIDSLLAPCFQPQKEKQSSDVWKEFHLGSTPRILSLHQHPVAICGGHFLILCPSSNSWLHIPAKHNCLDGVVLPSATNMMIIGTRRTAGLSIFNVSLKMSSFDPESDLSVSALQRLQHAGFDFVQPLFDRYKFQAHVDETLDFFQPAIPQEPLDILVDDWLNQVGKRPTWKSFLEALQEINLGEMNDKIKQYLSCDLATLKELSMAVVTSRLTESWKLTPEQLQSSLPDYVPTILKSAIVHSFKAKTLQLMPFPTYANKHECDT